MSGWKNGFSDEYPWCPHRLPSPCYPGAKVLCPVCKIVEEHMNSMEGAILSEKKRHDNSFDKLQAANLQIDELKLSIKCQGEREIKLIRERDETLQLLGQITKIADGDDSGGDALLRIKMILNADLKLVVPQQNQEQICRCGHPYSGHDTSGNCEAPDCICSC